jgi:hypothetical protein
VLLDPLKLTEHIHGHLGWLATATLLHPAIVLRSRSRRAHLAVALATGVVTVAAGLGAWLYVAYRERLKQGIFVHAPSVGLLFERKEHLAFGAVVLAWAGAAAYFAAPGAAPGTRLRLRTVAFQAFCASATLSVLVAILGTVVAIYRTF